MKDKCSKQALPGSKAIYNAKNSPEEERGIPHTSDPIHIIQYSHTTTHTRTYISNGNALTATGVSLRALSSKIQTNSAQQE